MPPRKSQAATTPGIAALRLATPRHDAARQNIVTEISAANLRYPSPQSSEAARNSHLHDRTIDADFTRPRSFMTTMRPPPVLQFESHADMFPHVVQIMKALSDMSRYEDSMSLATRFQAKFMDKHGIPEPDASERFEQVAWLFVICAVKYHYNGGPISRPTDVVSQYTDPVRSGEGSFAAHITDLAHALRKVKAFGLRAVTATADSQVQRIVDDVGGCYHLVSKQRKTNDVRANNNKKRKTTPAQAIANDDDDDEDDDIDIEIVQF